MMRIKLFGLFIAFALLALVRPRKCLELLEAADNWVGMVRRRALRDSIHRNGPPDHARGTKLTETRVPL